MLIKQLFFRAEVKGRIVLGAAELVRSKSKCVQIGKKWPRPLACNDRVTIAKEA